MEPIKRPSNVIVPRSVNRRIEARRALQGDRTVEELRSVAKDLRLRVPANANKETLRKALYDAARGETVLSDVAAAPAQPGAPTTGGE